MFKPSWVFYPHIKIAVIVFSESERAEQEAFMGEGELIREATKGEQAYQLSGIQERVVQYFANALSEPDANRKTGFAS